VVDARISGDGGFQSIRDNMARAKDTLMNIQVGDPDAFSNIVKSLGKLENNITVKAQHVIDQCKGGNGLLIVGVQCGRNQVLLKEVDNNVNIVKLKDNIEFFSNWLEMLATQKIVVEEANCNYIQK
jgi:hypothetical protein